MGNQVSVNKYVGEMLHYLNYVDGIVQTAIKDKVTKDDVEMMDYHIGGIKVIELQEHKLYFTLGEEEYTVVKNTAENRWELAGE